MADGITATLDTGPLVAKLGQLERRLVLRSLNRSLNRAKTTMGKTTAQEVREHLNLNVRDVKKAIVSTRVTRGDAAEIRVLPKPVPLFAYAAKKTKTRGVTFKVKRRGGRKSLAHGFIATMPNGHKGVFQRGKRKQKYRPGLPRNPIHELFSTSVRQYMSDKRVQRRVIAAGQKQFVRNLKREVRYIATNRAERASAVRTVLERSDFV